LKEKKISDNSIKTPKNKESNEVIDPSQKPKVSMKIKKPSAENTSYQGSIRGIKDITSEGLAKFINLVTFLFGFLTHKVSLKESMSNINFLEAATQVANFARNGVMALLSFLWMAFEMTSSLVSV
jgi:hypothetical protein